MALGAPKGRQIQYVHLSSTGGARAENHTLDAILL
jgi:hypothetical protein